MKQSMKTMRQFTLAMAAGVILSVYSMSALGQANKEKFAESDGARRAISASAQDVAEGKQVAENSCVRCHNLNGVSTVKGTPHIAGQRPGYLYLELKAYQVGGRTDTGMVNTVKYLSDDALHKVAAYYASLEPAAPSGAKPAPPRPDAVQAGKAAASGCSGCHGDGGVSTTAGMPSLVGLDPKYLVTSMKDYKSGARKNEMMKGLLSGITEPEMNNIALYYALQKAARAKTPAAGDQAAGKKAAAACSSCHGESGVSGNPATPSLAGQDAEYLIAAMKDYKNGSRGDETMKALMASQDDPTTKNLAAFYANLTPQQPKARKPLTFAELADRCDRCHGVNGNTTDPRMAALAAQRVDYLERVLNAYRKGERRSSTMAAMASGLSDSDVEALAAHYAQQKPRVFVFSR
jgi:cytochrome c553